MRIRTTILASAVLLALGFTGQAWAQQSIGDGGMGADILANVDVDASDNSTGNNRDNDGVADASAAGAASANNGGTATSSFSSTTAVISAATLLEGAVSGIGVDHIGNRANNSGDADGGAGGAGGLGLGGAAVGATGVGGDGGGDGEDGGNGIAGDATGGEGTGTAGGAGGDGGSVANDAGTLNMSNNMTSVGQSAAGIMNAAQNSGVASLIQQGVTVQANLTVGP